jgi:hypothetical protein
MAKGGKIGKSALHHLSRPSLPITASHLDVAAVGADDVVEVEISKVGDAGLGDQDVVSVAAAVPGKRELVSDLRQVRGGGGKDLLVHTAGVRIRASGADAVLEGGGQGVYACVSCGARIRDSEHGMLTADVGGESEVLADAAEVLVSADEEVAVAAPRIQSVYAIWDAEGGLTSQRCAPQGRLLARCSELWRQECRGRGWRCRG